MSQRHAFGPVLASLHKSILDDTHWPETSALIDEACGATGNALLMGEGMGEDAKVLFGRLYYRGEPNVEILQDYLQHYYPHDERLPRLRQLPASQVVRVTDLYTQEELRTSATYNEALRRSGAQNALNVRMDGPSDTRIVWSIADPVGNGAWEASQIEVVESLLPHIRQFVEVRQALDDAKALNASLIQLLGNTRIGVIQLDRRGRVVAANDFARAYLRRRDGLSDRGGSLSTFTSSDNAKLQRLLARALATSGKPVAGGSMTIKRWSLLQPLRLHVSPVGVVDQTNASPGRVAALVLVVDPINPIRIDPTHVGAALGLTPAESRIAALLAEGKSVRHIAEANGNKENAIRWHINRIHRKLGISRQTDLVRLVLSVPEISGFRL